MNGQIAISNFDPANVNPNSYNLTLDNHLKLYKEEILDSREENKTIDLEINEDGIMLKPGRIYIGSTVESTFQTDDLVPMLSGRSSYARLGIDIHKTAGFGRIWRCRIPWNMDIGNCGNTTCYYLSKYKNLPNLFYACLWSSRTNL